MLALIVKTNFKPKVNDVFIFEILAILSRMIFVVIQISSLEKSNLGLILSS